MRRDQMLLISLGTLSFAATLGVLQLTRGPLFGPRQNFAAIDFKGVPAVEPTAEVQVAAYPVPAVAVATAANSTSAVTPVSAIAPPPSSPEPARAELVTLRAQIENDADVRTRLTAVNSLRRLGLAGDADGYVRASLRAAMNDANPNVKSNAEQAYEMIAAQYGTP